MANYASTVTIPHNTHIPLRTGRDGIVVGKIDVTNYNSTLVEITDVSKRFSGGTPTVIISGISDNGYLGRWDASSKSIKCYYLTDAHTHAVAVTAGTAGDAVTNNAGVLESTGGQDLATNAATKSAGTEVANDVDCGVFEFIAYGTV